MFSKKNEAAPAPAQNPRDCGLQRTVLSQETVTATVEKPMPDTSSEQWSASINVIGEFVPSIYKSSGGRWRLKTVQEQVTTHTATVSCHRTDVEGLPPYVGSSEYPEVAPMKAYQPMAQFACAHCPYFGMDTLTAARYDQEVADARVLTAEANARALDAELRIARLRAGLGEQATRPALPPDSQA
jgi:hypothetical protein